MQVSSEFFSNKHCILLLLHLSAMAKINQNPHLNAWRDKNI